MTLALVRSILVPPGKRSLQMSEKFLFKKIYVILS